jgi:preprotein translocase subunit SecE
MNLINYIRETKTEMQKVTWPSRSFVASFTAGVIILSILVAYFLGLFDVIFTRLLAVIIG